MNTYYFNGQDIPYTDEDRYTVERDPELAHAILMYEERLKAEGDAPSGESLVALGRLYTIVSLNQKAMPLLQKALARLPDDDRPHKYLAIAHVDAHYQYDAALKEIATYTRMQPRIFSVISLWATSIIAKKCPERPGTHSNRPWLSIPRIATPTFIYVTFMLPSSEKIIIPKH